MIDKEKKNIYISLVCFLTVKSFNLSSLNNNKNAYLILSILKCFLTDWMNKTVNLVTTVNKILEKIYWIFPDEIIIDLLINLTLLLKI